MPVVLLVYKRPELTRKVVRSLRKIRPGVVLVVADGPKDESERVQTDATRRVIREEIDWPCDCRFNEAERNLGLANRVSSGITWALDSQERVVILEDDCVPSTSFFRFAEEMLDRYRNERRVSVVTGNNFQRGVKRGKGSYYFSMFPHCWGWATWRDRWQDYDHELHCWSETLRFLEGFGDRALTEYWEGAYRRVISGEVDSWAYRWLFSCWAKRALTVTPNRNLVTNIGFGEEGTHCKKKDRNLVVRSRQLRFPLRHPEAISHDLEADEFVLRNVFNVPLVRPLALNSQ